MDVIIDGVRYVPEPAASLPAAPDGDLGSFLLGLRERSGLSLEDAARRAGIARQYLWGMENCRIIDPSFQAMVGLSRAYGFGLESAATFFR